jgi:peptide/nickel transport system substrate-binding protein
MDETHHKLDIAKGLAGKGKISRREFVQVGLAAGLTAGAADTLFVSSARAQPNRGGFAKLGLAHGATTDSLDPAGYPDTFTQCAFWGAMSNSLTQVDAKGEVQPDLAESFEYSDGAKTWAFRLRRGVTFHNGKSVTAEDVVASIRYHMGRDTKSAAKALLSSVGSVHADGPDRIVFKLTGGNADFPYLVSDHHFPVMPASDGRADWQSGARTGPFILEHFQPGVSAKFRRNPNYHWDGKPYLDQVEFIAITDVAARMNALSSGEVDYISRPDLKTLGMLKRNKNIQIVEKTSYGHYTLPMNVSQAPFDNPEVRQALKWAIDRDEILRKVFFGHGTVANDNPIAPGIKYAATPQPQHTFDRDKARYHLRRAGLDTLKVDLSVSDAAFSGAVDAAALIRETAAKCGIDVNVVREAEDAYWDNVWLKRPWCASYWAGRPTADWMFTIAYGADSAWNETFWKNPQFNTLLAQARAETDQTKRAAMYEELQQLTHDDGGSIVLVFNSYVSAKSKKLAHGELASNWENDGLRIAERWWLTNQ